MNVRGISQQKCPPSAKLLSDSMMYAVSRKPIYPRNVDFEIAHRAALHVLEPQVFVILSGVILYRTYETRSADAGHGEYGQEIRVVEIDMQFTVDRRSGGLNVGDIK